ncbi:MAG TPA: TIGR03016 family PEP-CTERM system-associated outer membrane protein [Rhodanobacteraceae bacterium]|nr:TIGR03016 family PEP-CTERM system-associated outer membrane protein [Rhodanobacteraceae bacterium]
MRSLSAPVVLSSIALAGWLTGAAAQTVGDQATSSAPTPSGQTLNSANLPPGTIPQPTLESPGTVTGITLGELYTDNLKLAASDQPKQTSFITEIQPFIKTAYSSPRFSGLLNYTLTGYVYAGHSGGDQLAQNLDAMGTLTIAPQHLFLDGTAVYGRQIINNELPAGAGTFFLNNNRANVAMATLSPYWVQQLGNVGTMILRYTRGRVMYNRRGIPDRTGNPLAGIPDITSNAVQFSVVSPKNETWGWHLNYSQQQLDPDFGPGIQFASAELGISRQLGPNTRLLVDGGKENNYLPDGTVDHLGADFWDAGFEWANTLDSLRVLVGHRFYGHSAQFSWTHTAALLTTTLSYEEQPTDLNQQLLGQNPGQLVTSPVLGISQFPSLAERRVYLMKRATASAAYTMPHGNLRLTLYDESRDYFLSGDREKVANANLSWLFYLGPFTTLTPTVGWQRYQFQNQQINYNHYLQLAFVHQFDPHNFASLKLRNDSRNVDLGVPGARDYRVNVLYFEWTHLF